MGEACGRPPGSGRLEAGGTLCGKDAGGPLATRVKMVFIMMPDFKRFSAIGLLQGFSLHQLTGIFDRVQARQFPAGSVILNSASTDLGFYFVIEGAVRIAIQVNEQEIPLSMLYAGDFFGEASVVEGGAPAAEVRAEEDTVVYLLPSKDFFDLTENSPALAARFWEALTRTLITRMKKANATIQEYFSVNRALCENPKFRELYRLCQFGS
jgi:signal-transduction protein with cAMP-binding, CBS, and nucleotidyltransferase domain